MTDVEPRAPATSLTIPVRQERFDWGDAPSGCSVPACLGDHYTRGLCRPHYDFARWRGQAPPLESLPDRTGQKKCRRCGVWKLVSEFDRKTSNKDGLFSTCKACRKEARREYLSANEARLRGLQGTKRCSDCGTHKDLDDFTFSPTGALGRTNRCKPCATAAARKWAEENPDRRRSNDRRSRIRVLYGVEEQEIDAQWYRQEGRCPVCCNPVPMRGPDTVIDHSHEDGALRGILHRTCNLALGHLGDDPEVLRRAAAYIEGGGIWGN